MGEPSEQFSRAEFDMQIDYLKRTPQVRDVLLSGGDPLTLAPKLLAELIARLMEDRGVTKAELARRLGKSRAWVTQLLSGRANMTLRTFAEVTYALGAEVALSLVRL